jgi:hypothetical protein
MRPDRRLEKTITVPASPARVFAWLDDPRNTGLHMSRPSMAMLGGALRVERLSAIATGVGATYRSWGRVLGLRIDFTTTVVRWVADREKVWRTTRDPRLIVLGHFEMRFGAEPVSDGTRLTMVLEYELPPRGVGRLVGRALAAPYAKWCLRRMCRDARTALGVDDRRSHAVAHSGAEQEKTDMNRSATVAPATGTVYTCPMHPEVRKPGPGTCPKCGMALEPVAPAAPTRARVEYTCPMHPQIVRDAPGTCPICGMALEPRTVAAGGEEDTSELRDMTRRFWISLGLSLPLLAFATSDMLPSSPLRHVASPRAIAWLRSSSPRRWCSGVAGPSSRARARPSSTAVSTCSR